MVIFGPNGSGKTNILEAVSMLSPGRGLRRAAAGDMVRNQEGIGWKVTGEIPDHTLETWTETEGGRQVRIDGKAATQIALGNHVSVVWLTPSMDRLWTEGSEGRRRFLDRMVLSFDPSHGEATLTYEKAMRERNRLLKDNIRDAHWYTALEIQMADSGARIQNARESAVTRLSAAQANAHSDFPRADLTIEGSDGQPLLKNAEDLREVFQSSRPLDLAAGRTLVGPHRSDLIASYSDKGILAKSASTGEQKALLISLVLANARALDAEDRRPILLLDEVAAHLDVDRRRSLYSELDKLNVQSWMTGTGSELFEDVAETCFKVEVSDQGNGSSIEIL